MPTTISILARRASASRSDQSGRSQAFLQGDLYTGTTGLSDDLRSEPRPAATCWRDGRRPTAITCPACRRTTITPIAACPVSIAASSTRSTLMRSTTGRSAARTWSSAPATGAMTATISATVPGFFFDPRERTSHRVNVFAQDEIHVARGFFVTVGSKFERNEFTGFEIQPTVRARWSAARHSVWGAVSRAVRVPTRFDTDLRFRLPNSDGPAADRQRRVRVRERPRLRSRLSPAVPRAACRSTSPATSIATTICARRSCGPGSRYCWPT